MSRQLKQKQYRNKKYLAHVRQFPCSACGRLDTEAHHVRFAHNSGTGMLPGDFWCIPLCKLCHNEWHQSGMRTFQRKHNIYIYEQLFMITKAWIEKQKRGKDE